MALQLVGPLSYYAGLRDSDDERFAWRMFSSVRVRECRVLVAREGEPPRPVAGLHGSWLHALERGRSAVIARYLATRCAAGEPRPELLRSCRAAGGARLGDVLYRYDCATQSLATLGPPDAR